MSTYPVQLSRTAPVPRAKNASYAKLFLGLFAALAIGFLLVQVIPESLLTVDTALVSVVALALFAYLTLPLAAGAKRAAGEDHMLLWAGIGLWSVLLIAERLFFRMSTIQSAYEGSFVASAYAEAMVWGVCFFALLIVSLRHPDYLRSLGSPAFRSLTLLAVFCVISSAYSPSPGFSLAWAMKFLLAVLVLRLIFTALADFSDLRRFLLATLLSFLGLTVLCIAEALLSPDGLFRGDRLTEDVSPTGVSAIAAVLALLSLTFYFLEKRARYAVIALLGMAVMMIGGGKAAILSAVIAGTLFFCLRRNLRSGLAFLGVVSALSAVLVMATPLHRYISFYLTSGQADTATGRTELWSYAAPRILDAPLFGHGFSASKFISIEVDDLRWPAGHLHNGFLEVLYNNGILGLLLLLAFNIRIVRNLIWTIRQARTAELRNLAVGAISIYVFLIGNGMFNATFGGRPGSSYLMMIALIVISEALRVLVVKQQHAAERQRVTILIGEGA
ncbi:MAG TPA: O-antigen ligase family protein [Terriglobales bacterium]